MTDKPKASGPLWMTVDCCGRFNLGSVQSHPHPGGSRNTSCRLIPGHGQVVPLELVQRIASERRMELAGSVTADIDAAIKAAIEGAV